MAKLIYLGELDGASDASMAEITRTSGTEFRAALEALLTAVAVEVISEHPNVVQAAVDAVADALATMNVVTSARHEAEELVIEDGAGVPILWVRDLLGTPYLDGTGRNERPSTVGGSAFTKTWLVPVCGQSNAMGVLASPIAPWTNEPLRNLLMVPQSGGRVGTVVPAADPLDHAKGSAGADTRGFAVAFARWLALRHPDVRVVLIPLAVSGTGLYYTGGNSTPYSWAPDREGESGLTSLYREAITKTNAAAALFTGTVEVPVILWHQMEADAVGGISAAQYEGDSTRGLLGIIDGFRAQMPNATSAVFLAGQTVNEFRTVRKPGTYAELDAVLQGLPSKRPRVGFAPAPGPGHSNPDNTHFTGKGQWLLHKSFVTAYENALYGA